MNGSHIPRRIAASFRRQNAIEALNRQLRKAVKMKGSSPSDESARKLLYLAIHNAVPQWRRTAGGPKRYSRSRSNSETDYPTSHQPARTEKRSALSR